MLLKKITILVVFFISTQFAFAQHEIIKKRFPVKSINYEDGLLDNSVSSIITDVNGYTWVAAFTGLQRFNGYKLQTINPVAGSDTFYVHYPVMFFELSNGDILISMKEGVLQYNPHTDKFSLFIQLHAETAFHYGILPLKETNEGLWCMQQNKGITLYSMQGKLLQQFSFFDAAIINGILQSDRIFYQEIFAADDQFIYINDLSKNILCIRMKEKKGIILNAGENFFAVNCLHHKLYVSNRNSLDIIDENGFGKKTRVYFDSSENITSTGLQVADEAHFFYSRSWHVYYMDTAGSIMFELTDRDKNSFIKNGNIQKIYPDKFNRIWILSNNDIKRIQNSELLFENFAYTGERSNFIRALYYDDQKNILLAGGYDGMIQAYDTLANPLWKHALITKQGEYILNIEKVADDTYLVIPYNRIPFLLNAVTQKITALAFSSSVPGLQYANTNYPNNVQRINDSVLMIATGNKILQCIYKNGRLQADTALFSLSTGRWLSCFLYDADKLLWIGTGNGLLYRVAEGKTKTLNIPNNYTVRSIAENSLQQVCVGTEKGLLIYDRNGILLKKFNIASGLRNDCIYAIATHGGDCYVSTNLGISSISQNGAIHNYSKEMGLQDNEFNTNAVLKLKSGKMFFGGINGITAFYPSALTQVKDSVLLNITDVFVNDISYNSSSGIWHGDDIQLTYKQNRLRFDAAAMGMLNVNEYVYQYRMIGFDTVWQTTYQPTNINYILQPGNYTFEIKCHPLLSAADEFSKSFSIIITPPFWQTWWFRITASVFALGIIYFVVYRYNRSKYLKKIRVLETQQQIQTERERISRELHDNIGAQLSFIISNIDWAIDSAGNISRDEEKQRLQSINSTARNVMGNLRESIWALNKEKITLEEFADKLKAYIQNIIELKPGLEFISHENIQMNISLSPTETLNIFRICQEVINNVIKHAAASVLKIFISSDANGKFSILIEDNGKGFDVKKNFNGHYGLQNINHRAAELNLKVEIQSQPDAGTSVLIH